MDNIKYIEGKINSIVLQIEEYDKKLTETSDKLSLQLTMDSYKYQLQEWQAKLRLEKIKREKEFVEVRLKGVKADGSIALELLSKLADGFLGAIFNASTNIQFGSKKTSKKSREVVFDTLDMRLAGIAPGSTRLYITANTAPDLFGRSLAEESLQESFRLLSSNTPDELTESASKMGKMSIAKLSKFISAINENDFEVDIKWSSPDNTKHEWNGKKERMLSVLNSLSQIDQPKPEIIVVEGELITISLRGIFEIKETDTHKIYRGKYANQLQETMKTLNAGIQISTEIEKEIIVNHATQSEKIFYTLVSIK